MWDGGRCITQNASVNIAGEATFTNSIVSETVAMGYLIILTGAAMMLIAMVLDWWYIIPGSCSDWHINFFELINRSEQLASWGINWYGTALPLIFMIAFASIAIVSAFYALTTGKYFKKLWLSLSLLSVAALLANFLYVLVFLLPELVKKSIPPDGY